MHFRYGESNVLTEETVNVYSTNRDDVTHKRSPTTPPLNYIKRRSKDRRRSKEHKSLSRKSKALNGLMDKVKRNIREDKSNQGHSLSRFEPVLDVNMTPRRKEKLHENSTANMKQHKILTKRSLPDVFYS